MLPSTEARELGASPFEVDSTGFVVFLFHLLFNRNPTPEELDWCLDKVRVGTDPLEIWEELAATDEAVGRRACNPHLVGQADGTPRSGVGDALAWKAEDRPAVTGAPFSLFNVELTNRCPFRCVMCPRTEHMTRSEGLMAPETFRRLVDQLAATEPPPGASREPVWLHHFGESLVHPEVGWFIRHAQERGVGTRLSINPLLLTEALRDELLDAAPVELLVSLDGHDDDSFAAIRGLEGVYDRSRDHLERFLDEKVARGVPTKVTLSMIDFPLNEDSESSRREECERTWLGRPGIDAFTWKPFTTWNGDAEEIAALSPRGGRRSGAYERARERHLKVTCDWPWTAMTVLWNGDVVPCCYDYDGHLVLGNVGEETLAEIWNGPRMQALRREFASNHVTNPLCRTCPSLFHAPP